jgi:hypothetical protein
MENIDFSKFKNSCELLNHIQTINKRQLTPEEFKPLSRKFQDYKQSIKKSSVESKTSTSENDVNQTPQPVKQKRKKKTKQRKTLITDEVYKQILELDDESAYKLFLTKFKP